LLITNFASLRSSAQEGAAEVNPAQIGDASKHPGGRPYLVVTARVHPGETPASYVMRGVLQLLLGPSDEAAALRERFVFIVFPMLNPDGVQAGHTRGNSMGHDLNRYWETPPPGSEVGLVKRSLASLHESGVYIHAFLDLHAHSGKNGAFTLSNPKCVELPDMLAKVGEPLFDRNSCTFQAAQGKRGSARCVVWRELDVQHSHTLEASYAAVADLSRLIVPADLVTFGETLIRCSTELPVLPPEKQAALAKQKAKAAPKQAPKQVAKQKAKAAAKDATQVEQ